jgi:pimeloyl-ACP methyl ester carboxylesterase
VKDSARNFRNCKTTKNKKLEMENEFFIESEEVYDFFLFQNQFMKRWLIVLFGGCLALIAGRIGITPYGTYEMKQCISCSTIDSIKLSDSHLSFKTWTSSCADNTLHQSPRRVDSIVLLLSGSAQRESNVDDFAHRLFEAHASFWTRSNFIVFAPILPLLSGPRLATFADNDAAASVLSAFCDAVARRFGAAGCHVVGLSNGGIASIQLALHRPAQILSLTVFASGLLEDHDFDAIRQSDSNALCAIPVLMLVGTRDAPFFDAAIDTLQAIKDVCGQHSTNQLIELDDTHHWNIVENAMKVVIAEGVQFPFATRSEFYSFACPSK